MTWAIATPIPRNNIRRWWTELAHLMAGTTRATRLPEPRRQRAHRKAFIEDAAMAREMLRL